MDNRTGGPNHATDDAMATVVFVDLAGFSAIADVFGDAAAIGVLDLFETLVRDSVGEGGKLVKWIGDEAMLLFPEPDLAVQALSRLLPACRANPFDEVRVEPRTSGPQRQRRLRVNGESALLRETGHVMTLILPQRPRKCEEGPAPAALMERVIGMTTTEHFSGLTGDAGDRIACRVIE